MTPELRHLSEPELFDWLRLIRSENIGPRTFFGLLERYRSAGAALEALPGLAAKAVGRSIKITPVREIQAELDVARRAGIRFVAVCEPHYPPSLRAIDSAPPLLAVKGSLEILQRSMVAIVGSRNASAGGLVLTERLARGLGEAGHVVVSGLARGIDARAHLASLETGTVGVLAGGHDRIYPSEHVGLVAGIAERGAVVSEMPLTWEPRGRDFPRRNRIVSGLGLGVVVVEAARRSGSLITARFANEQGREVFAVPGFPLDPRSEGGNDLLAQGATLCRNAEDVTAVLRPMTDGVPLRHALEERGGPGANEIYWDEALLDAAPAAARTRLAAAPLAPEADEAAEDRAGDAREDARARIIELVGSSSVSVDDLVRVSAIPVRTVQSILVELELDGLIVRHGGHLVARAPV